MSTQKYKRADLLEEEEDDDDSESIGPFNTSSRLDHTNVLFESDVTMSITCSNNVDHSVSTSNEISFFTTKSNRVSRMLRNLFFWIRRRTYLEKALLTFSALLILLLITMMLNMLKSSIPTTSTSCVHSNSSEQNLPNSNNSHQNSSQLNSEFCMSSACIEASARILASMDPTVNPCDDFHRYSCGGWEKRHYIQRGTTSISTFSIVNDANLVTMKGAIENGETMNGSAQHKVLLFYKSCMDMETKNSLGDLPLKILLNNIGGWPDVELSNKKVDFSLLLRQIMALLAPVSMTLPFFIFFVDVDHKNSSLFKLQIDQSGLGITRDYYFGNSSYDKKMIAAYKDLMKSVTIKLSGKKNSSNLDQRMENVFNFECDLANITIPDEDRRDDEKIYNILSIKELDKICSQFDWLNLLNNLFHEANITFDENEAVLLLAKPYLSKLCILFENMNSTIQGQQTLRDYVFWRVVHPLAYWLSQDFRLIYLNFLESAEGIKGEQQEWKSCVQETAAEMPFAVSAMFVNSSFMGDSAASKEVAQSLIKNIRESFAESIMSAHWMDKETKAIALDKANSMCQMIAYPEWILKPKELNNWYNGSDVAANDYFGNRLRLGKAALLRKWRRLRSNPMKDEWKMSPADINAYYDQNQNCIVFPAGILQSPFFHKDYPDSLNYGGIGVVVGHEITHGFDDNGREYDRNGNLRQWWKNTTLEAYRNLTSCMIDQYSNYHVNGVPIRGKLTLGENIADNGGVEAALVAYQKRTSSPIQEPLLPGLGHLSHEKLFFVAFAQIWCQITTLEAARSDLYRDPHTPSNLRSCGALSNNEQFSKTFGCEAGSKMNPIHKCHVW